MLFRCRRITLLLAEATFRKPRVGEGRRSKAFERKYGLLETSNPSRDQQRPGGVSLTAGIGSQSGHFYYLLHQLGRR